MTYVFTNTFTAMHDPHERYPRNLPKYQSLHEDVYFSKGAIQPVHLNWDCEHMPPQTLYQECVHILQFIIIVRIKIPFNQS